MFTICLKSLNKLMDAEVVNVCRRLMEIYFSEVVDRCYKICNSGGGLTLITFESMVIFKKIEDELSCRKLPIFFKLMMIEATMTGIDVDNVGVGVGSHLV